MPFRREFAKSPPCRADLVISGWRETEQRLIEFVSRLVPPASLLVPPPILLISQIFQEGGEADMLGAIQD